MKSDWADHRCYVEALSPSPVICNALCLDINGLHEKNEDVINI